MSELYKRSPVLNRVYKDGSRQKDLGAAASTNPYPVSAQDWNAWNDGWNKLPVDQVPKRGTMNFVVATTSTEPGLAGLGLNTAAFATVTNVRLNFTTSEGSNIMALINSFVAGERILISNKADPLNNWASYTIQSQTVTTFATLSVTYVGSAGSLFTTGMPLTVAIG